MLEVNLLPWRERQRERKRKVARYFLIGSLSGLFVLGCIFHFSLTYLLEKTEKNTSILQAKLAPLNERFQALKSLDDERARLLLAIQYRKKIAAQSAMTLALFDTLLQKIPIDIVFNALQWQGKNVILSGTTHSAIALSKLTTSINHARLLEVNHASPMQFKLQILMEKDEDAVEST